MSTHVRDFMAVTSSVLLFFTALSRLLSMVEASPMLGCAVCYPKECDKQEKTEQCEYGRTLDYCGCCLTCANGPNERCGGINNIFGTCADGLLCLRYDNKPGKFIVLNIAGRCVPRQEYDLVIAEAHKENPTMRALSDSANKLFSSFVPLMDTAVTAVRAGVDGIVAPLRPMVEAAAQRARERGQELMARQGHGQGHDNDGDFVSVKAKVLHPPKETVDAHGHGVEIERRSSAHDGGMNKNGTVLDEAAKKKEEESLRKEFPKVPVGISQA